MATSFIVNVFCTHDIFYGNVFRQVKQFHSKRFCTRDVFHRFNYFLGNKIVTIKKVTSLYCKNRKGIHVRIFFLKCTENKVI